MCFIRTQNHHEKCSPESSFSKKERMNGKYLFRKRSSKNKTKSTFLFSQDKKEKRKKGKLSMIEKWHDRKL
jgi:hypothetical protein